MGGPIEIIAGLGNPGSAYRDTRHNAGFWFVDAVASRYGGVWKKQSKFFGWVAAIEINGHPVRLFKPETFMNHSGRAIAAFCGFYRCAADALLVAHDELDLSPGDIRLKKGGGHGGHNGLRDILSQFHADFWRLRIGVGHPGHKDAVIGYVLAKPPKQEWDIIQTAMDRALEQMPLVIEGQIQRATQALHTR